MAPRYPVQVKCFAWLAALQWSTCLIAASAAFFGVGCKLFSANAATESGFASCSEDTPSARELKVGTTQLAIQGRVLDVKGLKWPWTLAAFSGPAPSASLRVEQLAPVKSANPALVLVLGGLGETEADVLTSVRALGSLALPVLIVEGGRDRPALISAALEKADIDRVIDISALHEVHVGSDSFAIVPGAAQGKYAQDDAACGHSLDELKALSRELGARPEGQRRFIWAWHAPGSRGPFGVARDGQGVDTGDPDLAELATRIGAPGGLFGWPHVRAGEASIEQGHARASFAQISGDLALVVPRLGGAPLERADGGLVTSSAALLTVDQGGVRLDAFLPVP